MPDLYDTLLFSSMLRDKPEDQGGVKVNATNVTLTITRPDLTMTTVSPANPPAATGDYLYRYTNTPAQAGDFDGLWVFTLADGTTESYLETVQVRPGSPGYIISLADVKAQLSQPGTTWTVDDEELRRHLGSATAVVEHKVGPVRVRSYTDVLRIPILPRTPVVSVTSITPTFTGGIAWTVGVNAVVPDLKTGEIFDLYGRYIWGGPWTVTYLAGRTIIPDNIAEATAMIVAHLWELQRGPSRGTSTIAGAYASDDTYVPGFSFSVPRRALELLEPDLRAPAVA